MLKRRIGIALAVAVLLAILVDRIVLYAWGLGVITFYRTLDQSLALASTSKEVGSITDMTSGDVQLMFQSYPPPERPMHVGFEHSIVRPDHIRIDSSNGIHLWYLPPVLAWTTRLYPPYGGSGSRPKSYRPVDYYQYDLVIRMASDTQKPMIELYRSQQRVPPTTRRPDVFP